MCTNVRDAQFRLVREIHDEHPNLKTAYHLCIQVKGKCSNIVLDQCKKTGLVLDSVMVGVEMVNCQSVQVQVRHKPLIVIT